MASFSNPHGEKCTRCGSSLVNLEWDERVSEQEVQDLWHCWNCDNEFITVVACDAREPPLAEITKPFFTSLLLE